jgi:hypothetical protein
LESVFGANMVFSSFAFDSGRAAGSMTATYTHQ